MGYGTDLRSWHPNLRADPDGKTPAERHVAMSRAQRLKRVFDIETCDACGGAARISAAIEDPTVIPSILDNLAK